MARLFYTMIILLLALATSAIAEPSCKTVAKGIVPCVSYIRGKHHKSDKPSNMCCKGLNDIANVIKNGKDRVAVCKCIKMALSRIHYDPTRITLASQQCHTPSSLPSVGQNTNCARAI
uniref:Non-specific lipid-transfer protein-like n=1 Tax=Nicotiana tabacum TaxID=4097 RepID=A0A1S3YXB6_TOBAC|nr:non-specific lipid-transfer protein-like [Nicotiana tomentosiformis]XP_016456819.1 PREDICTED: non-specific lipid-transfer protein-like [Nicotiana tabacum]